MRLLIVEDDSIASGILAIALSKHAWVVDETTLGEDACQLVRIYDYDLIIMDLGLPDVTGPEILRRLHRHAKKTPIFVISGDRNQETIVRCLKAGASDYLVKPIQLDEVQARILAMVRRAKGHAQSTVQCGPLTVNLANHQTYLGDRQIKLTRKETSIFEFMALNKNRVISKESLMEHLYDADESPEHKIIDVFICKLRKKFLEETGERYIHTSWGKGYILLDPEDGKAYEKAMASNKELGGVQQGDRRSVGGGVGGMASDVSLSANDDLKLAS